jgi:hypothetical protein
VTRRELEDRVRGLAWPSPPAALRERVLAAAELRTAEAAAVLHPHPVPMNEPRALRRPVWRTAPVLFVVAAVISIGACTGLDLWAKRELDVELARLQAKYGSLDEATSKVPAVPDADNRARVVRAALELMVPRQDQKHHYIQFGLLSPVPVELRAFADANRSTLRLLADIRTRQQSNWEIDYHSGTYPPLHLVRILSDAVYVTCLMEIEAGRPDDAAALIASGLGVSASIRQEPDTTAQMTRLYSVVPQQLEAVRLLVSTSTPSAPALKELAWWLAENRTPDPVQISLLSEMKRTNTVFTRMARGDIDRWTAESIYPATWPDWPSAFLGAAAQIGRPFVRKAHGRYLQHMEHLLDVHAGPRPLPVSRPPAMPQRWALVDRLVDKFIDGTWGRNSLGDNFTSALGVAEIGVALRRYKLDRFEYPAELSALVPGYLDALPIDAYTGRTPAYSRQGSGFTLQIKVPHPETKKYLTFEWDVKR